jgi:hypothetical protein
MLDFHETYSRMSDDQLLDVAMEIDSLTPPARVAFDVEMQKRRLGTTAIAEHREIRRAARLEAEGQPRLAWSVGEFGTELIGARDFKPDGSFLTTKWIILFWVPLIPLKSLRIRYVGPRRPRLFGGWSSGHVVCSEHSIDIRQVASTYAFMALFFVGWAVLKWLHAGPVILYSALGAWICLLLFMRWRAKRKGMRAS